VNEYFNRRIKNMDLRVETITCKSKEKQKIKKIVCLVG